MPLSKLLARLGLGRPSPAKKQGVLPTSAETPMWVQASLVEQPLSDAEKQGRRQAFLDLNQDAYGQLVTFADFAAEKLTLGFVAVNFARDQALLLEALEQDPRCGDIQFERFRFDDPELRFLRDALLAELPQRQRQPGKKLILVITGLEQSIGLMGDYPPVLQDLNYVRDAFAGSVPHPILVVLPDGALSRLARFAPDFWAWRLGVFEFRSLPDTAADAEQVALRSGRIRGSLGLQERQKKIDLLLRLLRQYEADGATEAGLKAQIEILNELGVEYKTLGKVEDSERCLQQALRINPHTAEFSHSKSATLYRLAQLQNSQGQLDEALQHFQTSLELYGQLADDWGKASVLHEMAIIYATQGQVDQAIALYQQSLELKEKIGNVQGKAATLHEMAGIYANQGKVDEAIALYQQSIEIEEKIGNVQGKAATLHQMAIIYANQGKVEEAIALYQQSLELQEKIGNVQGKAATLHQMAGIYANQGNVEEAIALYQQSLELKEKIGDVQGKAATLVMMGQLLASQGQLDRAIAVTQESLMLLQQTGSWEAPKVQEILDQLLKMQQA